MLQKQLFLVAALLTGCSCMAATSAAQSAPSALPPHPRLILTPTRIDEIKHVTQTNPEAAAFLASLKQRGEKILSEPPIPYSNCTAAGVCRGPWGFSYISANTFEDNVKTMSMLHSLDVPAPPQYTQVRSNQTSVWADRALKEMLNAATFPSWYWPVAQALELSAMASGMAFGYDWLYSVLTPAQRDTILKSLVDKALRVGRSNYHEGLWWTEDVYNWNLVSNTGMVVAALAVMDPTLPSNTTSLAEQVLETALRNMEHALPSYAPAGVWPEGSGYWNYATSNVIKAASSLQSATGSDRGILNHTGLKEAGLYDIYLHGPSWTYFNWADSHPSTNDPSNLLFLGSWFNNATLAAAGRLRLNATNRGAEVEDLLYFDARGSPENVKELPLSVVFADPSNDRSRGRKTHLGFFRNCWLCENATWVAFKGGENHFDDHGSDSHNNHGHLDLGQFVFETKGQRWAVDIGSGQYDFPDISYFGRFRFTYYHTTSFGHNVLHFDNESQDRKGNANIDMVSLDGPAGPSARINLTAGYARGGAEYVHRGMAMADAGRTVIVRDEFKHTSATQLEWRMHTPATVSVEASGRSATLSLNGETISMRLVQPSNATLQIQPVDLPFPQTSQYSASSHAYNLTLVTVAVARADGGPLNQPSSVCVLLGDLDSSSDQHCQHQLSGWNMSPVTSPITFGNALGRDPSVGRR